MRTTRHVVVLLAFSGLFMTSNGAWAQAILASDDTWVREDNPTSNRNENLEMNARTDSDADDNDVILLRFDVSAVEDAVEGAEIRLTWLRSDGTSSRSLIVYGLNETHEAETTWGEATVVYNDAPGLLPDGMDPTTETTMGNSPEDVQDLDTANLTLLVAPVGYGPQVEGEEYALSSPELDAFINADTNGQVTFLILRDIDTSGNQARFMTKENTSSATGVVTGDPGFAGPWLVIPEEPPPTTQMILVSHDTWVREDNPTSNRNENLEMNARTDSDADDNDVILLRFDVTAIEDVVEAAEIRLTWHRSDGTASRSLKVYGLNETHEAEATWDEAVVVYNDAPGLLPDGMDPATETAMANTPDDVQDLDTANLTLLVEPVGYGPQVEGEEYSFASPALDAFINADTNGQVTFLILRDIDTSGNQARFMTKENTSSATGVITGEVGFAGPWLVVPDEPPPPVGVPFIRGDSNNDLESNISDAQFTLNFLFLGGPGFDCAAAGDANDDGETNISDAQYVLNFLFLGGPAIPAPLACGDEPLATEEQCATSACPAE